MQNEQNIIDQFLTELATVLGPLSPFAKAIIPAALALATAVVKCLFDGQIDATSLTIAGSGLVLALVVFFVPNVTKPAPAPAPTPAKRGK